MSENKSEKRSELSNTSHVILHSPDSAGQMIQQADSDDQLIALWLHGRPKNTQRGYRREIDRFIDFVKKPFRSVKLIDLQAFADHLGQSLKPSSANRAMSAVKSLLAFGHRLGYLQFDVGRALKLPGFRDELSERIISETEVLRIISLEPNPRNRAILLTFYAGGFRVSEICALKWRHLQDRDSTGQITVFAKGEKTRSVLMPRSAWDTLMTLRGDASLEAPVFRSRKKGHLCESAVWRVVKKATKRAGIPKEVSCHWFRHAHASHSLDRGAPIHLVQATLGHSCVATTGRYLHARPSDSSGSYLPLG
ncbi:tyrosine-type recombinase/integrase [Roseiconus nitratireducens]|uniref:Tyrosine-type recombinase/integrase n=1 Tax=Roseiconus nitratireducens TaxID=2605748 RepID=A0A5M6CX67_9BACT|nr:tyrosine-type recombinase/integrase [Roseiconus nitratireducens]KAA5538582.1 tyrosine-type recombinase/integrase [Roseiconus nitratireducens]